MPTKIALANLIDRASVESLVKVFAWLVGLRLEERKTRFVVGHPVITEEYDGVMWLVVKLPLLDRLRKRRPAMFKGAGHAERANDRRAPGHQPDRSGPMVAESIAPDTALSLRDRSAHGRRLRHNG